MRLLRSVHKRIRSLLRRGSVERELENELKFHLDQEAEYYIRQGMSAADARRSAAIAFGGIASVEEECREARGLRWLRDLGADTRYTFRQIRKAPAFALAVIASVALGVGGNTLMFSVLRSIVLRPLPFVNPDRLVIAPEGAFPRGTYLAIRERTQTLEGLAAFTTRSELNLTGSGEPVRMPGSLVSDNFFDVLGVRPTYGRAFLPGENDPARSRVIVISHGLWRERFSGDPQIIGKTVTLEGANVMVIGVAPPGFRFPNEETSFWMPVAINPTNVSFHWGPNVLHLLGRMKPGAKSEQVRAELSVIMPQVRAMFPWRMPDSWYANPRVSPLHERLVRDVSSKLKLLSVAVLLVLLIGCANIANLLMVRSAARRQEMAIRRAIGASAARLARQLIGESMTLAVLGGLLGLGAAAMLLPALVHALPELTPRRSDIRMDAIVLAFAFAISLLSGVLFALLPAWRVLREGVVGGFHAGTRASGGGFRQQRLPALLAVGEVALSVVLVASAALVIYSLGTLMSIDPGFRVGGVLTARISPSDPSCREPTRCVQLFERVATRLAVLPGVISAGFVSSLPLEGSSRMEPFQIEGHPLPPGATPTQGWHRSATPGYTQAMGIPLLHGRTFEPADQRRTRGVALINASMAAHFWQEGSAIGRRIKPVWWRDWLTIVGVVGDVHHHSLSADPGWEVYTLFGNVWGPTAMAAVIHTNGDLNVLAGSLRGAVAEVDASIPVSAIRTVPQVISRSLAQPKLFGWTMASFAGLALTLATLGIYSVIAYGVAQRRHEIGIRLALGAQPGTVRWGVLRCGLLLSLSGLSAGLILTAAASRALRSQLFNISPMDPRIYTAVAVILLAVGCLAAWIPARTAARLDPAVTLRAE